MQATTTRQPVTLRRVLSALFYRDGTSIFSALRTPDFRNLWIGQMISFVGDALAFNTLSLSVIRMASDEGVKAGGTLSTLFVLSALPSLFLGMVAGTIVDRSNRKRLMIAADIIRGFLALGFLAVGSLDQVWIYVAVLVSISTVSTFFFPARTAMLPLMLEKDQLLAANALAQLTQTLAFVVGAALAGVMVGMADATAPAFMVDSLSFFVSAFFIARISISGKIDRPAQVAARTGSTASTLDDLKHQLRTTLGELWIGLRYVLNDQVMRGVLISFLALFLGLGAANITFYPLLIDDLGMPEEGLGLVRFSQTLGIVLSSATIAAIATRYKARHLIGLSMLAFGVMTVVVSAVNNYALMVAVLFVVGLTISPPQIVAQTLMQRHVPGDKLGRASGAQGAIVNVANIASMGVAGLLMDEIGARLVFFISGTLIFGAGIVSWMVLRGVEDAPGELSQEPAESVEPFETTGSDLGEPVPEPVIAESIAED